MFLCRFNRVASRSKRCGRECDPDVFVFRMFPAPANAERQVVVRPWRRHMWNGVVPRSIPSIERFWCVEQRSVHTEAALRVVHVCSCFSCGTYIARDSHTSARMPPHFT